ncbi:MAG: hypothetical protein ACFCVG_00575 [Kineosporiaceae bacterium]
MHPLLPYLLDAAAGDFPVADGGVTHVDGLPGGRSAVVSFTGHAVIATDLPWEGIAATALDGLGGATDPRVLTHLAGPGGRVGVLDVTLVSAGTGGGTLPRRADLDDHPRVRYAADLRTEVTVHGDDRGLVTLAHGLAGRTEMSVAAAPGAPTGTGRALITEARALVPLGEPVFAAVSPGNARSLRAFLSQDFTPIASEVILTP